MQQEAATSPHVILLLSNAVTAALAVITTLTTLRFKQKREPTELRRIDAETMGLKVAAEISPVGITLETLREIQSVIDKAEVRREAWLLKEEELRTQIGFWRNKAEEMDGDLIELREAFELLQKENDNYEQQLRKMEWTLRSEGKNYDNTQDFKPEDYTLPPKS